MKRWHRLPTSQTPAVDRDNLHPASEAESYARAIAARHVTITGIAPIAALGLMLTAGVAQAAVINVAPAGAVDQTNNNNCSLIEAIIAAQDNLAVDNCPAGDDGTDGGDTVVLPANGTFTLTTEFEGDVGLPVIFTKVTIAGNGGTIQRSSALGTGFFGILGVGTEGDLTVQNTTLSNGNKYGDGGGIHNSGGVVTLVNSTITGNTANGNGGGIFNNNGGILILKYSEVSENHAVSYYNGYYYYGGFGGGIWNGGEGTVTLTNSTVSMNIADGEGGGGGGGGIYHDNGNLTLTNSTLSGNSAEVGGGLYSRSNATLTNSTLSGNDAKYGGGGIAARGSTLTLTNSTVSGNTTEGLGGGIIATKYSTLTLTSSTVTGNTANAATGGLYARYSSVTLDNSIIASQTAGSDCSGFESSFIETDVNLDSDDSCFLESTPDNPLLLPLAFNGGPTQTHALCTGVGTPDVSCAGPSPALDGNEGCSVSTDQRGVARPQGVNCDIGAFEALPAGTTFDFGDAPDAPYPTLLISGGAQHVIVEGFMLGSSVTAEANGQPNATGTGDDGDDGVSIPAQLVAGSSIMVNVTVTDDAMGCEGVGGECKLDAWVDFNGDGDWSDDGEQIAENLLMVAGVNALPVDVPATLGTNIGARFRLSRSGELDPTGIANDGEVEDYVANFSSSGGGGGGGGDSCDSWEIFGWCTGIGAADHWTLLLIGLLGLWRRLRYTGDQSG
jgi:hypothetical protein